MVKALHTDATCLSTYETSRNTAALDLLAGICGGVVVVAHGDRGRAAIQSAIERLDLRRPELECTSFLLLVTTECNLGWPSWKHVENLAV